MPSDQELSGTAQKGNPTDWEGVVERVHDLVRVSGMNIARALQILDELNFGSIQFVGGRGMINRTAADAYKWPRLKTGVPIYRLAVVAGKYAPVLLDTGNQVIRTLVQDEISEATDAVVELGCGYARHVLRIRDTMEHRFPHIRYYGADLSDSGLVASKALAQLEPSRRNISFHKFNWLAPDFSFIEGSPRRVVFYSCHSIEQVQFLGDDLIPAMTAVAPEVTAVHEEPFGWQVGDRDSPNVGIGLPVDQRTIGNVLKSKKYNENLAALIQAAERDGKVKLRMLELDASGDGLHNPGSLAIWDKVTDTR